METIEAFRRTPEVSFIDNITIEQVKAEMITDYEGKMSELSGEAYRLPRVHEMRFALYAAAAKIYQAFQYVDRAGKRNLLKYSPGAFLDNLAAMKGVERMGEKSAVTTVRFTASARMGDAIAIPAGTRVSARNGKLYFATDRYAEIPAGAAAADVKATCTEPGELGNGLEAGNLNVMVDPVPYVASVSNTTVTEGGADAESDKDLADRVYLAPGAYSTAGTEDGYRYHAMAYSQAVGDVEVTSEQAAYQVDVCFLLADGTAPGEEMIEGMKEYISAKNLRPMNDLLVVSAPTEVPYSIDVTYYINRSDSARAMAIQGEVQNAVAEYQKWQRKIGRDVNPSELVYRMKAAGAKRIKVRSPGDAAVGKTSVSKIGGVSVIYGGLEDD